MTRALRGGLATVAAAPLATFITAFVLAAMPGQAYAATLNSTVSKIDFLPFLILSLAFLALSVLGGLLFGRIAAGIATPAVLAQVGSTPLAIAPPLVRGVRLLAPLALLGLTAGLAVVAGLVMAVLPGLLLYVMWAVAGPAMVAENLGVRAALTRSADLTRGARWRVFGLLASLFGMNLVIAGFAGRLIARMGWTLDAGFFLSSTGQLTQATVSALLFTLFGTVQAALYVELREWKDGPAADRLAEIFA